VFEYSCNARSGIILQTWSRVDSLCHAVLWVLPLPSLLLPSAGFLPRLLFIHLYSADSVFFQNCKPLVARRLFLLLLLCSQFCTVSTYMYLEMYQEFNTTLFYAYKANPFLDVASPNRTYLCMAGSIFSNMLLLLLSIKHGMRDSTNFTSL
jgi:hypothetical protein